nr:hypothetical protein [Tanacetum cinerariifolium]
SCSGQVLAIQQNTALFSLLGTRYGGNGTSTFALPNLNGRTIIGADSSYPQGTAIGTESVQLSGAQLPPHTHSIGGPVPVSTATGSTGSPAGAYFATTQDEAYGLAPSGSQMAPMASGTTGLSEIRAVGFGFAPVGWATCNGQALPISDYEPLYQLIGTTYGGDGVRTFNVPNLNGAVVVGAGQGNSLSNYQLGQRAGAANVTLNTNQVATHNHAIGGTLAGSTSGTLTDNPVSSLPGPLSGSYNPSPAP